jgi:hypothetical protein
MPEELVIAGVDPGTTVGYAVVGLDGKPKKTGSRKELSMSDLLQILSKEGIAVSLGTDKSSVPGFISKLGARLGARVMSPKKDLLVTEKRALTQGYKCENDHERDALAGAIFAYKEQKPLIKKIQKYVNSEHKQAIEHELMQLLLQKDPNISVKNAAYLLERPAIKKDIMARQPARQSLIARHARLLQKYEQVIEQNKQMHIKIGQLKRALAKKDTPTVRMDVSSKVRKTVGQKDRQLDRLGTGLAETRKQLDREKSRYRKLKDRLHTIDRYHVCQILQDLGSAAKRAGLKSNILLVKDAKVVSQRVLERLSGRIIIASRPSSRLRGYVTIDPKDLNITEIEDIALVRRKELDALIDKKGVFRRIVDEYQSRR